MMVDEQGSIWAGTSGGLIEWKPEKDPRVWTRADGLPGLRIRHVFKAREGIQVLADGAAILRGKRFEPMTKPSASPMWTFREMAGLPGPPIARAKLDSTWVWAVPKAGLFTLEQGKASPVLPSPPTLALTSVAAHGSELYVGTAEQGVLRRSGGKWTPLPLPHCALRGPDATALLPIGGELWIAPREGPCFQLDNPQPKHTAAPWRSAVTWNGQKLVRRADGRLVTIDAHGKEARSALILPRVNANAVCVERGTLFVAQPGGWSEFAPGEPPRNRFEIPELQGAPTTAILADEQRIAIGTQDRGLILVDRSTGRVRHLHEAHGLTDDWITALAPDDQGLLIGTFVGGLVRWDGERVTQVGLPGGCITRLLKDGEQTWVGSLAGVYAWESGSLTSPAWGKQIEPDVTDIAVHDGRLWIAAGGALFEIRIGLTPG